MAIYHMQQKLPNGDLKGRNTFFILDEFYSLGHLEPIAKSIGGMPGLNLHLWPFLQDYPQMLKLYGKEGTGTFMANCEVKFFYGVNDPDTAEYVSKEAGRVQEHELGVKPPQKPEYPTPTVHKEGWQGRFFGAQTPEYKRFLDLTGKHTEPVYYRSKEGLTQARMQYEEMKQTDEARYQNDLQEYAHARSSVGHPRVTLDETMQITKRNPKRKVSDFALVLQDGVCWKAPLTAYFEDA
jgi:hypothetical protein